MQATDRVQEALIAKFVIYALTDDANERVKGTVATVILATPPNAAVLGKCQPLPKRFVYLCMRTVLA